MAGEAEWRLLELSLPGKRANQNQNHIPGGIAEINHHQGPERCRGGRFPPLPFNSPRTCAKDKRIMENDS